MTTTTFVGVLAGLGLLEAIGIAFCVILCKVADQPIPSDDDAPRDHQA